MVAVEPASTAKAGRGRPQLLGDDVVLAAALAAFAEVGYEAMSLRSLGRELGLSHGALNQRFGSKDKLFYAAVDHGFGDLASAMADHLAASAPSTGVDALRNGIRAFLLASAERPQIVRLMNTLGIAPSERLDHVFEHHVRPLVEPLRLAALADEPSSRQPISTRALFFLVAHGAAAAYSLQALSQHFDDLDGPLDPHAYAEHLTDVVLRTIDA